MVKLNYLILALLIAFAVGMKCEAQIGAEPEPAVDKKSEIEASIDLYTTELARLKSQIPKLERILEEKNNDLNVKNNFITRKENKIEGQSQTISLLQNMVDALQQKKSTDTNAQVAKAYSRFTELESQVEGLKESIRKQKKERTYFKLQADEAEKKAKEQVSRYEKMEYFVSEQWLSVRQMEQALQIAEAIFLKAQAEAAAMEDDLLMAQRSFAKLELYRKFTNSLAVVVVLSVAWIGCELYFKTTDPVTERWKNAWIITAFWTLLAFVLLSSICVLWAPSHNAT